MTHRITMVAGEPSGDLLAARVIEGLKAHEQGLQFRGIGGPQMQEAGLALDYPMDALSVFGYIDAIKQLPRLISIYQGFKKKTLAHAPDVFVGVDAPDFNLRLEEQLKKSGIPTVQFVSPSIWAWRYQRIEQIKRAVDHMLVLFPFEVDIYEKEGVPVTFVGHPLAQQIPKTPDARAARIRLGLDPDKPVLAILPGSRQSELKALSKVFLQTAQKLHQKYPELQFVVPLVNEARKQQFIELSKGITLPNLHLFEQKQAQQPVSRDVMEACDAALLASGTASLEMALYKKPMVIAYILSPLMVKVMAWKSGQSAPLLPWIGLPNILLREFAVPEHLQEAVTPEQLMASCVRALEDKAYIAATKAKFEALYNTLAIDTPRLAAERIWQVATAR
ncbi:lipid-A-disaccharide synthase [Oligella urethralis]|uniref:lipid-A-disaccharide synthase n=1 Tax=Oligella urethralis TaxID=90245 RepID=UPI0027B94105|nr:lipid-A-disaccharide synthase [Oligella urethralis]